MKKDIYLNIAGDLIKRGNITALFPKGGSMKPFIKDGEKILVQSCDIYDIKPADIVIFRSGDTIIAHRAVKILSSGDILLSVKGDSSYSYDAPVTREEFLGRVVAVIKPGGAIRMDDRNIAILSRIMLHYSVFMAGFTKIFSVFHLPFNKNARHRIRDFIYNVFYQLLYFPFDAAIRLCARKDFSWKEY